MQAGPTGVGDTEETEGEAMNASDFARRTKRMAYFSIAISIVAMLCSGFVLYRRFFQ